MAGIRRRKPVLAAIVLLLGALLLCLPAGTAKATALYHGTNAYKSQNGRWQVLELPTGFKLNAIHAAMLPTGKVLLIAGSGNDTRQFAAGTFKTLVWDPTKGTGRSAFTLVTTPTDVFCGGHTVLPDGELLVAGGTQAYEKLPTTFTHAGGAMTVKNESPKGGSFTLAKGTIFVGPNGKRYRSRANVTVRPATARRGRAALASQAEVWVDAVEAGSSSTVARFAQYPVDGLPAARAKAVYGVAEKIDLDKQEYQGTQYSYVFNPYTERYTRVGDLNYKRWYPTLVPLPTGNVLAVSGLDGGGRILDGENEEYDPALREWFDRPNLKRYFPTYPWLTMTPDGKHLFYSGSNAGYGSATQGRVPGLWDLADNTFQTIPGLRDPTETETSATVLLPPLRAPEKGQPASFTAMILGGGGVGSDETSTARTDLVDLTTAKPTYRPGPDLARPTRYPNAVVLPDDTVLVTGGSTGYRGDGLSDNNDARIYHPDTSTFTSVAAPSVGRDYHSGALLLPSGQVLTFGGNSLFSDAKDTVPAAFEQRLEIYTPPYLYQGGTRPSLDGGPTRVQRGTSRFFPAADGSRITAARLVNPGTATHVTNVEQRSIALDVTHSPTGVTLSIPRQVGLVPSGWYLLFVRDAKGVPSVGRWIQIT
jgi:hypothetical protein